MRSNSLVPTVVALAFIAIAPAAQAGHDDDHGRDHDKYSVLEISLPSDANCLPGFWHATTARRMNEGGEVVGDDICVIATGDETAPAVIGGSDAFRWHRASGATMLPALSADSFETFAREINESGAATGVEFRNDGTGVAPLWPRAGGASLAIEPENCDIFFGVFSQGDGINDRGDVLAIDFRADEVGNCRDTWVLKLASGEEFVGPRDGVSRQLNNNDVGVGQSRGRAMRWSPATGEVVLYQDPTLQSSAIAWSINDRNEAVGQITHFDQACVATQTAAFWAANAQQTILTGLLGDTHTWAFAINNRSEIVGHSFRQPTCEEFDPVLSRAVIWDGTRAVDLNSLVPKRFAREFQLTVASAINDRGQIVVRGIRRGEPKAPCPRVDFNFETGENFYNDSLTCQNGYSFLLTPKHDRR